MVTEQRTQPDHSELTAICRNVIKRKRGMFAGLPALGDDDLYQESLIVAYRAHSTYNPAKARYSTWITRAVHCRLIDLWRVASKAATREHIAAGSRSEILEEPQHPEVSRADLPALLAQCLLVARRCVPKRSPWAPNHRYDQPQLLTLLALRAMLHTSYRGVLLAAKNPVFAAIQIQQPPSHARLVQFAHRHAPAKTIAALIRQAVSELAQTGQN